MVATTKPAKGVRAKPPPVVPRGTRKPQVVAVIRRPNRRFPRHWNATSVARVARYAVQAGDSPVDVQTAVAKALLAEQIGSKLLAVPEFNAQAQQGAEIEAALASITNWIPPIGIAVDTASSIYTRIHNFVALVRPDLAARFDRSLVLLQHEAQFAQQYEPVRQFLQKLAKYVQDGGVEVKHQVALINDALDNSPAAQGIRALAGFVDSLYAQAISVRDRLLRLIGR